jgi:hypothetical protein
MPAATNALTTPLRHLLDVLSFTYVAYAAFVWLSSTTAVPPFTAPWLGVGALVAFAALIATLSLRNRPQAPTAAVAYLVLVILAWFLATPLPLLRDDIPTLIAPAIVFAGIIAFRPHLASPRRPSASNTL